MLQYLCVSFLRFETAYIKIENYSEYYMNSATKKFWLKENPVKSHLRKLGLGPIRKAIREKVFQNSTLQLFKSHGAITVKALIPGVDNLNKVDSY